MRTVQCFIVNFFLGRIDVDCFTERVIITRVGGRALKETPKFGWLDGSKNGLSKTELTECESERGMNEVFILIRPNYDECLPPQPQLDLRIPDRGKGSKRLMRYRSFLDGT